MTTPFYYGPIVFSGHDIRPIVEHLKTRPEEVRLFQAFMLDAITALLNAGELQSARDDFGILCDVLAEVRRARGERVQD